MLPLVALPPRLRESHAEHDGRGQTSVPSRGREPDNPPAHFARVLTRLRTWLDVAGPSCASGALSEEVSSRSHASVVVEVGEVLLTFGLKFGLA